MHLSHRRVKAQSIWWTLQDAITSTSRIFRWVRHKSRCKHTTHIQNNLLSTTVYIYIYICIFFFYSRFWWVRFEVQYFCRRFHASDEEINTTRTNQREGLYSKVIIKHDYVRSECNGARDGGGSMKVLISLDVHDDCVISDADDCGTVAS
jgi:hypothetical protein